MPPLRIRMICAPLPSASMTLDHSFSAVWFGSLFIALIRVPLPGLRRHERHGVYRTFPQRDRGHDRVLVVDRGLQLPREPLRDVFRARVDLVERRDVVDAAVVERFRERLELLLRADEVDRDGVAIEPAAARGEVGFDFVRVPVQRLGDAAIFTEKVRRLEPRLDADGELTGHAPPGRCGRSAPRWRRARGAPGRWPASAGARRRGGRPSRRWACCRRRARSARAAFCAGFHPHPEVYNARRFTMPLPKSVTCSSCRRTYPEGWKRCPYCGHDELRNKQEQQARRFMDRKMREFEQRTGRTSSRKEDRPAREERLRRGGGLDGDAIAVDFVSAKQK